MVIPKSVTQYSEEIISHFNSLCKDKTPFELVTKTTACAILGCFIYGQLTSKHPLLPRLKKSLFKRIRRLPYVRGRIEKEVKKVQDDFEKEHLSHSGRMDDFVDLPEMGRSAEEVLKITELYQELSTVNWKQGSESGTVYTGDQVLSELMTKVYGMTAWTNPLHPGTFPGIRKMEAEVVRMCCSLFNGSTESCGSVTSGGTESIILAVKAYRDWAIEEKGIQHPNIVIPITAHAAFDKAGLLLDVVVKHVKVDPDTQKVNVNAMKKKIDSSTCMLVGSCPQFPHGSIDDIQSIAKLGVKYGIPVHVDACLGGFLVPFMKEAGYSIPPFDFSVDGVTSISADTHKYGYAPKGSSIILYSNPLFRHYQWFTFSNWPGGIYATSTIGGSKPGAITAACWASLIYHGRQGYVECTRKIIETTRFIEKGLRNIPGIKILGDPKVSVVAFGSDEFNIFALGDALKHKGWTMNYLQFPSSIHICVTMLHTFEGVARKFLDDVADAAKIEAENPSSCETGSAAIYGMTQTIPDRNLVDILTWSYLDSLYVTKSGQTKENNK